MDIPNGHCNGSRYIIENIHEQIIEATNLQTNEQILIPKIPLFSKQSDFPFIMRRLQFPIQLAYAMTFNRAQGQSVQKCGLLLENNDFTHGQLYVGLSMCGDPKNVSIFVPQDEFKKFHKSNDET